MANLNTILGFVLGVGVGVGASCSSQGGREDHCANQDGDAWCREKYPEGAARFCTLGTCRVTLDGCVTAIPADESCYAPCGADALSEDPSCDGVAEASSSSGTETMSTTVATEPTSATEPTGATLSTTMTASETEPTGTTSSGCVDSSECADAGAPICFEMQCLGCGDAAAPDEACAEKDAGLPVCGEDGACVQCTPTNPSACGDTTPVCDPPSSSCVGCTEHEQCAETACALDTGECLAACNLEVDGDGGADATTVQAAVDMVDGGMDCTIVVHGVVIDPYVESVVVADEKRIALLAASGEEPVIQGNVGAGIEVSGGAVLYARGLTLTDSGVEGLTVSGDATAAYVDACRVVGNDGGGVSVTAGGYVWLRNSFVGGDVSDVASMEVTGASAAILYTTLGAGFGSAAGLRCDGAATVNVRNSLLVARTDDPELDCATDSLVTSATEAELGDMNVNWFAGFAAGEFGLTSNIPDEVLTVAQWRLGDPANDIDGDARPSIDGTADVAGADIP